MPNLLFSGTFFPIEAALPDRPVTVVQLTPLYHGTNLIGGPRPGSYGIGQLWNRPTGRFFVARHVEFGAPDGAEADQVTVSGRRCQDRHALNSVRRAWRTQCRTARESTAGEAGSRWSRSSGASGVSWRRAAVTVDRNESTSSSRVASAARASARSVSRSSISSSRVRSSPETAWR